ncbi:MAG: hypothetical protein AAF330_05085 [Pseudomonadota bacterium]
MNAAVEQSIQQEVRRRQVFYLPGYDPFPPRRYREFYRKESVKQAKISGYEIALRPRQGARPYGWHADATIDGQVIEADIEVLVWADIVRDSMETGIFGTYLQLFRTAWTYIGSGVLRRLTWLRGGPVVAALYPIVVLLGQLLLALISAGVLAWLLSQLHPLASMLGLAAVPAVLITFRGMDSRFFAYYLMHDYAYSAQSKGATPPELQARMAEFGERIAEALAADVDEVLIVGHSSGAHLGVSILADLVRSGRVAANGPALNFLSLGHCVPMVSFLPEAHRLRANLQYLSECDEIAWVDVSAPGDGCSFALCDPVAVSGVATTAQRWPLIISAAFSQTLLPERWKALRRRYFRLHFQYLCAFDLPRDYDYFQITAGPITLGTRYAGRKHAKSRIDVPASKYTSIVA